MEAHAEDECPGVADLAVYVTRKYSKVETFAHQTMSQYCLCLSLYLKSPQMSKVCPNSNNNKKNIIIHFYDCLD